MEHLSMGALLGEPGGRGSFNGISKGRLWRRASLSMGAPFWEPGREPIYQGL